MVVYVVVVESYPLLLPASAFFLHASFISFFINTLLSSALALV